MESSFSDVLNKFEEMKQQRENNKTWCLEDEAFLIELWKDNIDQLRRQRKNRQALKNMSAAFEGRLVEYTPEEIKVKLHELTNKYKEEQKNIGGSSSNWPLYTQIHAILHETPVHDLSQKNEDNRPAERHTQRLVCTSSPDSSTQSSNENYSPSSFSPFENISPGSTTPRSSKTMAKRKRPNSEFDKVDKSMFNLWDQIAESNRERNNLLKELLESTKEFHKGVLEFLKK